MTLKLKAGWNIGLGDVINSFGRFFSIYNRFFLIRTITDYQSLMYLTKRNINIFLNDLINLSEEIISFHRIK